tara:strand:+ start:197 stop:1117 length:921 start_codon:yes stop_codon:yes gene_type:complete
MVEQEEEKNGLGGKIALSVLAPIISIFVAVIIICGLIATILRLQKPDCNVPFPYGDRLSKAITCKYNPEEKEIKGCMRGAIDSERGIFTIIGYEGRADNDIMAKILGGNVSFLEAMLLTLLKSIGDGLFPEDADNNLDKMFNVEDQPKPLGVGKSILVILKLAALFFIFMFLSPIALPFASIGGAVLGVYLNKSLMGFGGGIIIGIINILLMTFWVPGWTVLRLLGFPGIGGYKADGCVNLRTVIKNFMKHYGWVFVFALVVSEIILAIGLLGNESPIVTWVAIGSAATLLAFMVFLPKLFYKSHD